MLAAALALGVIAGPAGAQPAAPTKPAQTPAEVIPAASEVHQAIERGVAFLLGEQLENGSWGGVKNATFTSGFANPATYHCWTVGTTALVVQSLFELSNTDESNRAIERGLDFLIANADLKRPAEWDLDNNWGLVYGVRTLARALRDDRIRGTEREARVREAALTMLSGLYKYQSALGGWGYYANPSAAWRPDWATSFMTGVAVIGLLEAKEAGLPVDEKVLRAGVRAILRCRQPNGGIDEP